MDKSPIDLAQAFADVARALLAEDDLEATLERITQLAVETVKGCEHAGVSLIEGRRIRTPAASDEVARQVDAIQYEVDEGPCLDAMREHESFKIDDLPAQKRWPTFCRRATDEAGVAAMMSYRLFDDEDTMGALNLYSRQAGAFDDEAFAMGSVFATHAAVALAGAQNEEEMRRALETRDVIGQAKGILMAQQGVSADQAFHILRRASQRMNVKLREVAERLASRPLPEDPPGPE
ncbi:MAG: GAF and ANTAR domain-containing protein [Acidimicrobiales bacterium]